MTEPVTLYRVIYSERVRQRLKALTLETIERGDGEQFAAALKEFHRRLCIYPQFGEPFLDLAAACCYLLFFSSAFFSPTLLTVK